MDFFTHQQNARNRSAFLVVLFLVAIIAIIAATYFSLCILSPVADAIGSEASSDYRNEYQVTGSTSQGVWWWQPHLLWIAAVFTLIVIGGGSLYKISELRGGGHVVATSLGGTLVSEDCQPDDKTRRLLNIVEEMALASGVAVPPVFVLEHEASINAFAAGYTPNNAVIGVSRGAIETLSRDELQGVIAHEYSHILNGDMRINIRLMGVLHGILLIAIIGFYLIRIAAHSSSGSRNKNNSAIYLIFLGIAAVVIGSVGLFFARIIKASLSRQREFLADASAVQFTRNPAGIAGALKKIQDSVSGSRIINPESEVASHLFFGNARRPSMASWLSTHPPLGERIRRIDPFTAKQMREQQSVDGSQNTLQGAGLSQFATADPTAADPSELTADDAHNVHQPQGIASNQGRNAKPSLDHTPTSPLNVFDTKLLSAAHHAYGARLIVAALLFSPDAKVRKKQCAAVDECVGNAGLKDALEYYTQVCSLTKIQRLQLLDLCHASLMSLSVSQARTMTKLAGSLVAADGQMGLFEFMVQRILSSRLVEHPDFPAASGREQNRSYRPYKADIALMLSAIVHASGMSSEDCNFQFNRAMKKYFPHGKSVGLLPRADINLHDVGAAMDHIASSSSKTRQKMMDASADCISSDKKTTTLEMELLRALSATLALPFAPIPVSIS